MLIFLLSNAEFNYLSRRIAIDGWHQKYSIESGCNALRGTSIWNLVWNSIHQVKRDNLIIRSFLLIDLLYDQNEEEGDQVVGGLFRILTRTKRTIDNLVSSLNLFFEQQHLFSHDIGIYNYKIVLFIITDFFYRRMAFSTVNHLQFHLNNF